MVSQRKDWIQDDSEVTNQSREMDIPEPEVAELHINLGKLNMATKPNEPNLV